MTDVLRVAILCSADSYRGSAVSFLHIAQGLAARGVSVQMFAGHPSVIDPLRRFGVDIVELDLRSTSVGTARRARAALRAFGADVLMVDRPRDLRLGFLATLGSRVALVNRYNAHAATPPNDILLRTAYGLKVAETIFLTQERAARILPQAPWIRARPHRVIPEGISMAEFYPDVAGAAAFRARHGLGDAPFVLSVGAFTKEKRTALLIEAMQRVPDAPQLVLCGEGPLAESLQREAETRGVRTLILSRVVREELRGMYSAATLFAHACPVETFGLSVLEAMACGAPVVGVRGGGLIEVVGTDDSAGLLVAPEDAAALAEGVRRVLDDGTLAAGLRERGRVRAQRFTLDAMADAYFTALSSVAARA